MRARSVRSPGRRPAFSVRATRTSRDSDGWQGPVGRQSAVRGAGRHSSRHRRWPPASPARRTELAARLASVLEVVYLIFNEGYAATSGDSWTRAELCEEAMRLGRMLAALAPNEPEVHGLVALMEIHASRTPANTPPACATPRSRSRPCPSASTPSTATGITPSGRDPTRHRSRPGKWPTRRRNLNYFFAIAKPALTPSRTRAATVPEKRRWRRIGHSPRARRVEEPDEFL